MDHNEKTLQEQQAPQKNTDHAFVQVGKNGEPVIPETAGNDQRKEDKRDDKSSLDKR